LAQNHDYVSEWELAL